jgi:flagellin
MSLVVNTNIASLNAINKLNGTQKALGNTFARISSGLRINKAADDAAGLAVSENLDAAARSLEAAKRNGNDGISIIQTAEGAATEVTNIVKRMRELAVQSASETLDDGERAYIQDEFLQLTGEVDRIAATTNFNGINLADGVDTTLDVQVGINDTVNDRITIALGDLRASTLGIDSAGIDLSNAAGGQAALTTLDAALDDLNGYRSNFGAIQNRLESSIRNIETYHENLVGARSRIVDADFAAESANMAKYNVMSQAGTAILGQANQISQGAVRLLG